MIFRGSHPENVKLLLMASPAAETRSINCLRVIYKVIDHFLVF